MQAYSQEYIVLKTAFLAVIIVFFTTATLQRNLVWDTKLSLWTDVAQKSPKKARTHNNLGNCYMLLGHPFKAIEEYKITLSLDPNNVETYYNLGLNLENVGIINQAVYYYDIFCKGAPPAYADQKRQSCERVRTLSPGMNLRPGGGSRQAE